MVRSHVILLTRKLEERKKENGLLTVGYAVLINFFFCLFFSFLRRGGFVSTTVCRYTLGGRAFMGSAEIPYPISLPEAFWKGTIWVR